MRRFYCDFETFYSDEYSLKRMDPCSYILDPRFEALGAGVCIDDAAPFFVAGPDLPKLFAAQDWARTIFVCHNGSFDASILAWRYGHIPAFYIDTLAMSRATIYHKTGSVSLAKVSEHLGIGAKMDTVLRLKNYRFKELVVNGPLYLECMVYAMDDVAKCRGIFRALKDFIPREEWGLMDDIVHMVTVPQFRLDQHVLHVHLQHVLQAKAALLARVSSILDHDTPGTGKAPRELMSNQQFATLLLRMGVEPPMKKSPTTGKETYAFAKTDAGFQELLEHDDVEVQALAAARVGFRSTIEETRTQRFMNIASLRWPDGFTQKMPVPLRYSGAHTHRLSGDWNLNMQNLGRGSPLRKALVAPDGYQVVAADESQIEARVTAELAGCTTMTSAFRRGVDVYARFASQVYGHEINKDEHPLERFLGKVAILGLGYGMSWPKFKRTVTLQSEGKINLDDAMAYRTVLAYRTMFYQIPALWEACNGLLWHCQNGTMANIGPVWTRQNEIVLPSGLAVRYHNLRREPDPDHGTSWRYDYGREVKKIYGAKCCENLVQALARIIVMDVRGRLRRLWPQYRLAATSHDSLVYMVRDDDVQAFKVDLDREMVVPPVWMPDVPLGVESHIGRTLAEAEGKS